MRGARQINPHLSLAAGVTAVAVLLVPSMLGWGQLVSRATTCREVVRVAGPFACYGEGFQQFVSAARWGWRKRSRRVSRFQPKASHLLYAFRRPKPDVPAECRSGTVPS